MGYAGPFLLVVGLNVTSTWWKQEELVPAISWVIKSVPKLVSCNKSSMSSCLQTLLEYMLLRSSRFMSGRGEWILTLVFVFHPPPPHQEVFSAVRDRYMRDGEGFLLVYSLTERSTFVPMSKISEQIKRVKDTDHKIPIILVGNKVCSSTTHLSVSLLHQ